MIWPSPETPTVARLLLATLFLIFGWRKLGDFPGTVNQMAQLGVPTPLTAAAVATFTWRAPMNATIAECTENARQCKRCAKI